MRRRLRLRVAAGERRCSSTNQASNAGFDLLVLNMLLTRGPSGVYRYSVDREMQNFLEKPLI